MTPEKLQQLLEAALMAYGKTMSVDRMKQLFEDDKQPSTEEIKTALEAIKEQCQSRGIELKEVATGYRFQAKQDFAEWIARLWEEKPPKYSRALLETVALVAYRQPITRAEIEEVRGVAVSSHIVKTLLEREWVRVVGHRDVPGRPALYATTKEFLDYFNLRSLEELPSLAEIRDLDKINAELELEESGASDSELLSEHLASESEIEQESSSDANASVSELNESDPNNSIHESVNDLSDTSFDPLANQDKETLPLAHQAPMDHSRLDELNKRLKSELSDEELAEEVALSDNASQNADPEVFNDSVEPVAYQSSSDSSPESTEVDSDDEIMTAIDKDGDASDSCSESDGVSAETELESSMTSGDSGIQ